MTEFPLACDLGPEELRLRREGILARLSAVAIRCEIDPTGLTLTVPNDVATVDLLFDVIRLERQCCRFLRFELSVGASAPEARLILTGPPGTGDFLRHELGLGAVGRPSN